MNNLSKSILHSLFLDECIVNVKLEVNPDGTFKKVGGSLWGYIEVESSYNDNKDSIFWDNMEYFLTEDYKKIKKEILPDLKEKNFHSKGFFKEFKKLLKIVRKEVKKG